MSWAYAYDKPNPTPCPRGAKVKAPKGASSTLKTLVTYSGRSMKTGSSRRREGRPEGVGTKQTGTYSATTIKA